MNKIFKFAFMLVAVLMSAACLTSCGGDSDGGDGSSLSDITINISDAGATVRTIYMSASGTYVVTNTDGTTMSGSFTSDESTQSFNLNGYGKVTIGGTESNPTITITPEGSTSGTTYSNISVSMTESSSSQEDIPSSTSSIFVGTWMDSESTPEPWVFNSDGSGYVLEHGDINDKEEFTYSYNAISGVLTIQWSKKAESFTIVWVSPTQFNMCEISTGAVEVTLTRK